MVFHLAGFGESLDPGAVFVNIAALADDRLFVQGDDLRVPELNQIILAAGGANDDTPPRIRLDSPTLDEVVRFEISPLNVATDADVEPGSPHALMKMMQSPLILGRDEILQAELDSNPAVAARLQWALLWFADGPVSPITGQRIFTARLTGTATLVADTWTDVPLTLDENLPPGDYQVVGARFESATAIAGRIIFRTGNQWRPGALASDAIADLSDEIFRFGRLGIWGEFPFTQLPSAEFFAAAGDTAEIVHLDLIRIRGG